MLSMLGEQYHCAGAFAAAFCINLFGCVMLTPNYGIIGAAFATSLALVFEALVLYSMVKSRLGLHAFAFGARGAN
jgi:O-antigen/teichoic acid export membrane protein